MTRIKPLIAAVLALGGTAIVPAAQAQRWGDDYPRYERPYRGGYAEPGYGYRQGGGGDDRGHRGYDRGYRSDDRGYRRCSSGTTGTILGALAGGLLGRAVDGRGDRALGTILGAGAGALAGHAVEKSNNPGFCR